MGQGFPVRDLVKRGCFQRPVSDSDTGSNCLRSFVWVHSMPGLLVTASPISPIATPGASRAMRPLWPLGSGLERLRLSIRSARTTMGANSGMRFELSEAWQETRSWRHCSRLQDYATRQASHWRWCSLCERKRSAARLGRCRRGGPSSS